MLVSAKSSGARVSFKDAQVVCRALRGKSLSSGKNLLQNLLDKKESLGGRYYSQTAENIFNLLKSAEANAKQKNLAPEKLFIKVAKADQGYKFIRPKSRAKFRGRQAKVTNLEVAVEERA